MVDRTNGSLTGHYCGMTETVTNGTGQYCWKMEAVVNNWIPLVTVLRSLSHRANVEGSALYVLKAGIL